MDLYLVAKGGDCSAGAMGNSNDAILIDKKHYGIVKSFLQTQLVFEMEVAISATEGKMADQVVFDNYWNSLHELSDANIFKHKYHCRTYWNLVTEDELNEYAPISIQ